MLRILLFRVLGSRLISEGIVVAVGGTFAVRWQRSVRLPSRRSLRARYLDHQQEQRR